MRVVLIGIGVVCLILLGCDPEKEYNAHNPDLSNLVPHAFNKFHLKGLRGTVTDLASDQRHFLTGLYRAYLPSMSFEGQICRSEGLNLSCVDSTSAQPFLILLNQTQTKAQFSGSWGIVLELSGEAAEVNDGLRLKFSTSQHQNFDVQLSEFTN